MKNLLLLILLLPSLLFAQGPGPCTPTLININLDQYPEETTWDIQDTLGNIIITVTICNIFTKYLGKLSSAI